VTHDLQVMIIAYRLYISCTNSRRVIEMTVNSCKCHRTYHSKKSRSKRVIPKVIETVLEIQLTYLSDGSWVNGSQVLTQDPDPLSALLC